MFNVAYGRRITINDLAREIVALTGSRSEIKHLPERAGDVKHSMAAIDKLRATGFLPTSDFDTGLAETIRFFQARALGEGRDGKAQGTACNRAPARQCPGVSDRSDLPTPDT